MPHSLISLFFYLFSLDSSWHLTTSASLFYFLSLHLCTYTPVSFSCVCIPILYLQKQILLSNQPPFTLRSPHLALDINVVVLFAAIKQMTA